MHLPTVFAVLVLGAGVLGLGKNDKPCKHKVKKGSWASVKVNFPTVETIKADMKKCGNMDGKVPSIFYSFGASADDARKFRDSEHFTKSNRPNIFYDTLPPEWDQEVAAVVAKTTPKGLLDFQTQYILNARKSQAMAELSPDSYLMAPKSLDIYTKPSRPDNVWREQEMPALQKLHRQITHVANGAPWATEVQWPKANAPVYPLIDADHKVVNGLRPLPAKDDDGKAGCCACIVQRDVKKPVHNSGASGAHCDKTCCKTPSSGHQHTTMATKTTGHHAHKTPAPNHPKTPTSSPKKPGKKTHPKSPSHTSAGKKAPHKSPTKTHTTKKTAKAHRKPTKARRT